MPLRAPVRLKAETLIELSEEASRLSPGRWSFALLRAGFPNAEERELRALALGSRDHLITSLRQRHLGDRFWAEPQCNACGKVFEIRFSAADIGLDHQYRACPEPREVMIEGIAYHLRAVSLDDVLVIEQISDPDIAARTLGARVIQASHKTLQQEPPPLATISEQLEQLDPMADIWLDCNCPECGAAHSFAYDPVHFIAREIRQMAKRIMQDVVDIARVFHWSERDILRLPEERRAYYVAEAKA